ncbi:Uncharacterised protein [Mycobacteroides abscessus subsp. abscessus]|nr:Uncharacterised protein [Mycobacteroides abscessus subsp. abscessus]
MLGSDLYQLLSMAYWSATLGRFRAISYNVCMISGQKLAGSCPMDFAVSNRTACAAWES